MADRIPPQNLEAERAVIGSVLIDNEVTDKVADVLKPEFFYDPKHQIIFEAMINLYRTSSPIDVLTLTAELKKTKKFKQIGGGVYLSEIISEVPTSANVGKYAEIVREMFIRRSLITFGAQLDEQSRNESESIEDILGGVEQHVVELSKDNTKQDFLDSATLLELQMKKADEYAKNPDALRGLPSGFRNVDKILGGFHTSDLVILAARPGTGKSAFAFNIARNVAVNEKKTVAIFSLEMPALQVMERMLSQQIQVDLWNIRMGKMTDQEFKRYPEGAGKLSEANILIDETPGISIMQLRSKARRLMLEKGLDMIIIDYLQLMQAREIENRAQAVGEMSRSLKILARELEIPVICLSQLNRAVENRSDRTPQLSDLRESGSIEQDADVVMFLNREAQVDDDEEEDEPIIHFTVAKHRNGPIGSSKLKFIGSQQRYIEVE
ncbi:replicative DNA helicase [Candidatus Dojkabacteria bacterium]|uniref:Replicative DNA helicase n=1 Tax=Candidatus Dojkabacteria bacterium TaxID=2099670 RepID=A0A955IAX7_9BACT|nr:replicative DNA helicase [Candidatus Dojkabacteria bacterium]